jgi:DNA-binding MarR family transcriptional regulator
MNNLMGYRAAGGLEATPSAKLIYLILLDAIDEKNKALIAQRHISEALGLNRKTVSRNLRR